MLSGRFVGDLICFKDCPMTVLYEIEHDLFSVNGPEWESVSEEAKRITHGLLQVDPSDRLQLSEVLESNWVSFLISCCKKFPFLPRYHWRSL